jgi:streptogramin lyase
VGGDSGRIGEYRIVDRLGAGGMGEVFLVEHPRLPRREALKLLDPGVSRNEEFRPRFLREADLLATLRHPNIVTVFDRGESEGRLWLSMEYIPGMDAHRLLRNRGPLSLDRVVQIVGGAGAALDYAYATHRITHRDVKPANMLLELGPDDDRISTVKLADFGIAKAVGESTSLTSAGITIGTMAYISPEAIEGLELDNRADIYSLACTAFQLLTGTTPFIATTVTALVAAHLTQTVPSIVERHPHLPPHLDAVFQRAMNKDRDLRHATCKEFVAALDGSAVPIASSRPTEPWSAPVHGEATQAEPAPSPDMRRAPAGRRWLVIAAVGIILAASVATVGVWARQSPDAALQRATHSGRITARFEVPGDPRRVAVDSAGDLYVTESKNNGVFKFSRGDAVPQALPFTGLSDVRGVAVSTAGDVYLADADNDRIVKLAAGSSAPEVLPLNGIDYPIGLAIDRADNLYIASLTGRVTQVSAGDTIARELPFAGLNQPYEIAVDDAGTVYVADAGNNRIVRLPAGAGTQQVLPFQDLDYPTAVAVDSDQTVYTMSTKSLVRLARDASAPEEVSVAGVTEVDGLAADRAGKLYVADADDHQILEIALD